MKYLVEWKMNGAPGSLIKSFLSLEAAQIYFEKKKEDCTTDWVELVERKVLDSRGK